MGSGPARQRALRKKARQSSQSTPSPFAMGNGPNSAKPAATTSYRTQLVHGWSSFSDNPRSFTLNQEAQNTHRSSAWNASARLRDRSINFVSGGKLHQDQPNEQKDTEAADGDHVPLSSEEPFETPSTEQDDVAADFPSPHKHMTAGVYSTAVDTSITEKVGQINLSAAYENQATGRARSNSVSSASSSDIILFAGRGNPPKRPEAPSSSHLRSAHPISSTPPHTRRSTPVNFSPSALPSRLKADAKEFIPFQTTSPDVEPSSVDPKTTGFRFGFMCDDDDDDEGILQDYIENVDANQEVDDDDAGQVSASYDRAGVGAISVTPERRSSPPKANTEETKAQLGWTSDDLRDFDELDTSNDDELTEIGGVFSRRIRSQGLQYLVTAAGQSTDEAKWIPHEKLTSTVAVKLIFAFEESHPDLPAESDKGYDETHESELRDSSDQDSEEKALDDLVRDHEAEHEDNERLLQRASAMSDMELARILNKQAELGYDNEKVMLFDGADGRDEDFMAFPTGATTSSHFRSKRTRRSGDTFPSAGLFADVLDEDPYNGFDVMDFERPSLKPKKKGRKSAKGSLPFELEDEELADQIAESWANDRMKKARRKTEREELRRAGLLGSKTRKGDRSDPITGDWQGGMNMDQVKAEVRAFLIDSYREVLTLASMPNGQRAQVHRLAKALHLHSDSHGKGDKRYPVITKTDFSGVYDEDSIGQIDALLAQRRFSTPWGQRGNHTPTAGNIGNGGGGLRARKGRGGGGVTAGATYMDGDVVGAAAPELGTENKGRAMLEKMGWSAGMGIGKVGNQGRVEVIKHVVKNTKAGLG